LSYAKRNRSTRTQNQQEKTKKNKNAKNGLKENDKIASSGTNLVLLAIIANRFPCVGGKSRDKSVICCLVPKLKGLENDGVVLWVVAVLEKTGNLLQNENRMSLVQKTKGNVHNEQEITFSFVPDQPSRSVQ
jgi:hypothetical protein